MVYYVLFIIPRARLMQFIDVKAKKVTARSNPGEIISITATQAIYPLA